MISENACLSFSQIFKDAVTSNVCDYFNDRCEITPLTDPGVITESNFIVLTITSCSFRFLSLLHFDSNELTVNYFSSPLSAESENSTKFIDQLLEFCNLVCGTMNRNLNNYYHYSGMSTPYVLSRPSLDYIVALNPGYVSYYEIAFNKSLSLHATVCICDFDTVDFTLDTSLVDSFTGDLEFL